MSSPKKSPQHEESALLEKGLPCPGCPSSDAFAMYSDLHGFCFAEGKRYSKAALKKLNYAYLSDGGSHIATDRPAPTPATPATQELEQFLVSAKPMPIKTRGLTQASCKRWDYLIRRNPHRHTYEQLAIYRDKRSAPVAIKIRNTGKDGTLKEFAWGGSQSNVGQLYGQHLWGSGGKILTITEGEIDAISVSQCFDHRWPVVSIPNGAQNAVKAITAHLEWISTFDRVVFMFDMDEPGRDAAEACAAVLPPGKAYIAVLTEKDANAVLMEGKADEITRAVWQAKPYRPDGIVDARELSAECLKPIRLGVPWPWPFLTKWTYGRRRGEVYAIAGGAGVGKSDNIAEIVASTISGTTKDGKRYTPEGFGIFAYESAAFVTKNRIAGKLASRLFHIPNIEGEPKFWDEGELAETLAYMDGPLWDAGGKLFINNSFGAGDFDAVSSRCRFLAHAYDIHQFVLDPLSAMIADEEADDERKEIDKVVRFTAKLAVELDATFYIGTHLTRPSNGPSHEEGGHVRLSQMRGSNAIGMFVDYAFGLERNTQADDPNDRLKTTWRVVKDRKTGFSAGKTADLFYDTLHGTLDEANAG